MPPDRMNEAYCVCPVCMFVCLFVSVVNFNILYNFSTVRDIYFIFGMYTLLMMSFQMTPSMTLTLTFVLK